MSMRKTQDRALQRSRTKYKPGFGLCQCRVCRKVAQKASSAVAHSVEAMIGPATGSPVTGCEYVNPELAFAEAWEAEQAGNPRMPLVQMLMRVYRKNQPQFIFGDTGRMAFWLTPRERVIVATVVQWLGTNIGMCFLREVLKRCGLLIVEDVEQTDRFKALSELQQKTSADARNARQMLDAVVEQVFRQLEKPVGAAQEAVFEIGQLAGELALSRRELAAARKVLDRLNLGPCPRPADGMALFAELAEAEAAP